MQRNCIKCNKDISHRKGGIILYCIPCKKELEKERRIQVQEIKKVKPVEKFCVECHNTLWVTVHSKKFCESCLKKRAVIKNKEKYCLSHWKRTMKETNFNI